MGYKFKCGGCGKEMLVKWLKPGEPAMCRRCGHKMPVPAGAGDIDDSLVDDEAAVSRPAAASQQPCTCRSCRWLGAPGGFSLDAIGSCRRYPPSANGGWPAVAGDDWCGEHFPKS